MIRLIIPLIFAAINAVWLVPPTLAAEPTSAADTKQSDQTLSTIRAYTQEKKREAVAYGEQLMQETDARIAQLEVEASRVSGEAKAKYEQEIRELKVMRDDAAAKLDKMAKASGAAWNEAKQGFADAYRDLRRAYHKAVKEFK